MDISGKIKQELSQVITDYAKRENLSQYELATALDTAQPRISNLFQGRVELFSVDMLLSFLRRLKFKVCIECACPNKVVKRISLTERS